MGGKGKVMTDQIAFEQPDIFGTQEMLAGQISDFEKLLPEYSHIGVARDDGKSAGEHSAIFYREERVKLLRHGDFWLSETPEKPSLGWDAACVRICTWGEFKERKSGKRFFFFNLHMDHVGVVARREAAKLVVDRIGRWSTGRHLSFSQAISTSTRTMKHIPFSQSLGFSAMLM